MKKSIKNLKTVSEPTGEQMTLFFPVGSLDLVNRTAPQASDLEKKMSATSGRKCLEQYAKFAQNTLWAKTFPGLLVGREGWFSRKCKLTWKLKGTKYSRLYFQLQVSTLRIEEIGFGLLLTPTTREEVQDLDKFKARMEKYPNGTTMPNLATQVVTGLLPTPRANQVNGCDLNSETLASRNKGNLEEVVAGWVTGLLPTPTATSDQKGGCMRKDPKYQNATLAHMMHGIHGEAGRSSQLNPQFVGEMMGFPPGWTELPFLNGVANP